MSCTVGSKMLCILQNLGVRGGILPFSSYSIHTMLLMSCSLYSVSLNICTTLITGCMRFFSQDIVPNSRWRVGMNFAGKLMAAQEWPSGQDNATVPVTVV